ncbi:MAG: saccharopine dehydrogenase C-terminal domain-containing protein [Thermodesulfobacteriota bacterium]|nr:saccharopine dehydrogenase C-terminal domain-containing protein [Thermodesulfobacteriota bacterium]
MWKHYFKGVKDGRRKSIFVNLMIERDLETGLFAMNQGVGYPVSIVAIMIGNGQIKKKGILSPTIDIAYESFMDEQAKRGIEVENEKDGDLICLK